MQLISYNGKLAALHTDVMCGNRDRPELDLCSVTSDDGVRTTDYTSDWGLQIQLSVISILMEFQAVKSLYRQEGIIDCKDGLLGTPLV